MEFIQPAKDEHIKKLLNRKIKLFYCPLYFSEGRILLVYLIIQSVSTFYEFSHKKYCDELSPLLEQVNGILYLLSSKI